MKAMIWKELRENARWALLGGFVLLLAEMHAISMDKGNASYVGFSLCGPVFLLVSAFGCCAVGAILGGLQILPELRRDQWASLLHRPIPREQILSGKMLAGLLLYAAATGGPLLVSIVYFAWPGAYPAPFLPGLALPAASDLALGLVFYAGALLVGLHPGRWLGTRGVIILAVAGVLMSHLEDNRPFALPVLAIVVLFLAARGAMRTPVAQRPWISRVAFGITILVGLGLAVLLLAMGLRALPAGGNGSYGTEFYIATDGTVFLQKRNGKGGSQLTDMEGKAVTDERYVGNNSPYGIYPSSLADRRFPLEQRFEPTVRSSQSRVEMVQGSFATSETWYRVKGQEPYFVGYDSLSKRTVGFFDREGFKRPGEMRQPFASVPQGQMMLQAGPQPYWIGSQIFSFDFSDRAMIPLMDVGSDRIYGVERFPSQSEHQRIAVALTSEIRVCDLKGALLFSIPYSYPAEHWQNVSITATDDFSRIFIQYNSWGSREDLPVHLDVFDGQGQRVTTYQSPPREAVPMHIPWNEWATDLLITPVPTMLLNHWNWHRDIDTEADMQTAGLPVLEPQLEVLLTRGELTLLCCWTLVLCGIVVVWARKAGLATGRVIAWVALTAVFGVAGLLAYRLCTDWPVTVRCPHCARRRSIGLRTCPNCQAPWEVPAVNGTEIFEPA